MYVAACFQLNGNGIG